MRTLSVGFRTYATKGLSVTQTEVATASFDQIADYVMIYNNGVKPVDLWFNHPTNDHMVLSPGDIQEIPLKVKTIYARCFNVGDSTAIEIRGYFE
jgi:hypothetical protein